jgi:NAD(P)-dependent dehydrogenase (short-subunit alcohol dehydrogenase family)
LDSKLAILRRLDHLAQSCFIMPPSGLAILMGAGPTSGAGIARMLASPTHGNLAVALLSRSGDADLASDVSRTSGGGILKAFKTDTSRPQLDKAFTDIKSWAESIDKELKLKLSIWSIKHSHRTPFLEETTDRFEESLNVYITGAMNFSQLSLKYMMDQYPEWKEGEEPMRKRGTLIFTGTLGALRTNTGYAAYGAGRSGVRMLAQSLAREFSPKGVHVVHTIANGGITDKYHDWEGDESGKGKGEDAISVLKGEKMRAESVGKLYLHCMEQECDLWVHEFDMRPAAEKF